MNLCGDSITKIRAPALAQLGHEVGHEKSPALTLWHEFFVFN